MSPKQMTDKICVSVPIGYWSKFLKSSLNSLKHLSDKLDVAILDASGDPRVAQDIEASGLTPIYYRTGPDNGQTDAISEGWSKSDAPFLAWLNADDMLLPSFTTTILKAFKNNPKVDLVYGHSTICDESGQILGRHSAVKSVSDSLYRDNYISQPSCVIRRSAYEKIGGLNLDLHFTMDWDLWLRLYDNGHPFLFLDEYLSNVSWVHDTKTSKVSLARLKEFYHILRRSQSLFNTAKGLVACIRHTRNVYRKPQAWQGAMPPLYNGYRAMDVPIINATETAQSQLKLVFSHEAPEQNITANLARLSKTGNIVDVILTPPLAPGASVTLRIKPPPSVNGAALLETKWVKT